MYFPRKILKPEVDVNTYYCYCRCCCCRWWRLLLGLLVLRPSISSLLQSATAFFITKCDGLLLQSATSVITKCDRYYKVWQFYYKVRQVLQSATVQGVGYILLSLVFLGSLFVKSEKMLVSPWVWLTTHTPIEGSACTQRIEEVNTVIPSSISNFLYRYVYLFTCMFNSLLLVQV